MNNASHAAPGCLAGCIGVRAVGFANGWWQLIVPADSSECDAVAARLNQIDGIDGIDCVSLTRVLLACAPCVRRFADNHDPTPQLLHCCC